MVPLRPGWERINFAQDAVEMNDYITYLEEVLPGKDSLKIVKTEAKKYYQSNPAEECCRMGYTLYRSENVTIQEIGVLLLGYSAHAYPDALAFLRDKASLNRDGKVQDALAMAFDSHCRIMGYEQAMPLIREWMGSGSANVRRAVAEGLRVWTNRPYFKENPQIAIALLADRREDASESVRNSVGNALRDISRKHPLLVAEELGRWNLSSKRVQQVRDLAGKFIR